jgi:hypothetical protein
MLTESPNTTCSMVKVNTTMMELHRALTNTNVIVPLRYLARNFNRDISSVHSKASRQWIPYNPQVKHLFWQPSRPNRKKKKTYEYPGARSHSRDTQVIQVLYLCVFRSVNLLFLHEIGSMRSTRRKVEKRNGFLPHVTFCIEPIGQIALESG